MPLLFRRKQTPLENETRVSSGWPVRITDFSLDQDFFIERKTYLEIYLVTEGTLLHTSASGRQSLRPGSVIVAHAGFEHGFSEPVAAKVTSLGFLPEWLAGEFDVIQRCPDLFSLIFVHCWLDYPTDKKIFVFTLPDDRFRSVVSDIGVIRTETAEARYSGPLLEVTFMKILLQLAFEFGKYWRHGNRIEFRDEIYHALDAVEAVIARGDTLRLKSLEPAIGMSIDHFGRTFKKATGSTLVDYAQKRRAHHAARLLLAEPDLKATAVARQLGFTDSAHLSKSFQKFFGHTPNNYRETFGSKAGKAIPFYAPATESAEPSTSLPEPKIAPPPVPENI